MLADPANSTDPAKLQEIGRERAELQDVVDAFSSYRHTETALEESELLAQEDDPELAALAEDEVRLSARSAGRAAHPDQNTPRAPRSERSEERHR